MTLTIYRWIECLKDILDSIIYLGVMIIFIMQESLSQISYRQTDIENNIILYTNDIKGGSIKTYCVSDII